MYEGWRDCPWYGRWDREFSPRWVPRRTCYEAIRKTTGLDMPNDVKIWGAWFKAHPHLVWDDKQKKLVDDEAYWKLLRDTTNQDFPNDPVVWETWFKAHSNLVWDEKQRRLVEPKPEAKP
jgi:hypothetical protein